jgi:hypothetical protein
MGMKLAAVLAAAVFVGSACQSGIFKPTTGNAPSLREVPSVRLGFRYEGDVPPPAVPVSAADELNPAVRGEFDGNRSSDLLARTIVSPDKKRILVAYSREGDMPDTFRLDMYSDDGKFLRRVSPDTMAVGFLDSIVWSPDSSSVAFVAVTRTGGISLSTLPTPSGTNLNSNVSPADPNSNSAPASPDPVAASTPGPPPPNVLTFRTEQIYVCSAEGSDVKPLTQTENLIYYYFVWSPDSSTLAALATRLDEWRYLQALANQGGEKFVPKGRPRIIEKNGRERPLDDALTRVHPAWSPDSAKVAVAFENPVQIRVYDAIGNAPTQAAIPLRNPLLISSQAYDRAKDAQADPNSNVAPVVDPNAAQDVTMLPDEKSLVSFQPIIALDWSVDSNLYFQTGYVREYVNSAEDRFSSLRWHRVILSVQGK